MFASKLIAAFLLTLDIVASETSSKLTTIHAYKHPGMPIAIRNKSAVPY